MYKAIDVYLEKKKTRQYVGRLKKEKRKFVFQYDEVYLHIDNPISLGPDLFLNKQKHSAFKLFPSFADRIPSRKNPAYEEYCHSVGIKLSEANPFVLLATLGKKGPSSFICVPVIEEQSFSSQQLKQFRKDLQLSIREFSDLFDVSSSTIYRIENNKTSGKDTLKRLEIYFKSPQTALDKIRTTGVKINEQKKHFIENYFKSQMGSYEIEKKRVDSAVDKVLRTFNIYSKLVHNKSASDRDKVTASKNHYKATQELDIILTDFSKRVGLK